MATSIAVFLSIIYTLIYLALHIYVGRKCIRGTVSGSKVRDLFLTEGQKFETRVCIFVLFPLFIFALIFCGLYQIVSFRPTIDAIMEHIINVYGTAIPFIYTKYFT